MKNLDLSPALFDIHAALMQAAEEPSNLFADDMHAVAERMDSAFTTTNDLLSVLFRAQRLRMIHAAGLAGSPSFKTELEHLNIPGWDDHAPLDAPEDLQIRLADQLYNVERGNQPPYLLLRPGFQSQIIFRRIIGRLAEAGIPFDFHFYDDNFSNLLIYHASEDGLKSLADHTVNIWAKVNNRITARTSPAPDTRIPQDQKKQATYDGYLKPIDDRTRNGDVFFTLTAFPTEIDAKRDGISYKDYIKLYLEMCDQPWDRIDKAHRVLIGKLNAAKEIRITNGDGTDIAMSLVDENGVPFTFCNSLVAKNVPGSEVFSAPRRDSVNGTIVAKGNFLADHDMTKVIRNLTLKFEKGKIVDFSADSGAEYFQEFLDRDPNNYYIGELGIGTNPLLKFHVTNGLLVEKIGGSFHVALGSAYTFKTYMGEPVHVNNGNTSKDHWDITTMLFGKGGRIFLDDEMIMDNGLFIDDRLDVLNRGWAAVPEKERPDYWKDYRGPAVPAPVPEYTV